jgi:hypothetical protein
MSYDIDQLLATMRDYEILEWFTSRAESGEDLTDLERVPVVIYEIDLAYQNGFSDLLWSYDVSLVYRGPAALEACRCDAALAATIELRAILDRYDYQNLMKKWESPLYEIDDSVSAPLLAEVGELEQKHKVVSREFSRSLIEGAHKFILANIDDFRRIGKGEHGEGGKASPATS